VRHLRRIANERDWREERNHKAHGKERKQNARKGIVLVREHGGGDNQRHVEYNVQRLENGADARMRDK
jgi:hypothetical protein